jgi:hypothetical protein
VARFFVALVRENFSPSSEFFFFFLLVVFWISLLGNSSVCVTQKGAFLMFGCEYFAACWQEHKFANEKRSEFLWWHDYLTLHWSLWYCGTQNSSDMWIWGMLLPTLSPPLKDNFQVSGMYRFSLVDPVFKIFRWVSRMIFLEDTEYLKPCAREEILDFSCCILCLRNFHDLFTSAVLD